MGFMQVTNSWLVVFPIIVILYYFFRKKYKRQVISSTLFWEEAMKETKASPYLKKLQKNALLFLQVAALLLFVFALMNPYRTSSVITGQQVIFVVDTSASMLAGQDEALFDLHKKELQKLVEQAEGKEITVVATGNQPNVIVRNETKANAVKQAIEKLEITYESPHMSNVLDVVQSFIGTIPTSVYIFTDVLDKASIPVSSDNVAWNVFGQEESLSNVAITKFAAMQQNNEKTLLIQMTNETDEDQSTELIINDENNKMMKETVTIPKGASVNHVLTNADIGELLKASIDVKDDYKEDNVSYTILQQPAMEVQLDVDMHVLIQKGFASVYDDVIYLNQSDTNGEGKSLIVTNKVAHLNGNQPTLLFGRDDALTQDVNMYVSSSNHALFNFSPLQDIYVQSIYPPFEEFEVIATVGEHPFIQLSDRGDIIVLTDIQATDWAMHPVFPLFLWSAIQHVSTQSDYIGTFHPKQSASIVVPQKEWSIFNQEGQFVHAFSNKQFIAPEKPGIYEMQTDDEKRMFTVDLSAEEKIIQQGETYQIGAIQAAREMQQEHSILLWFIPFILVLLLVEWEVQRRRGFTN
jgi:hypothetical protein